ncbi:hypothetical protein DJ71_11625 [Halorubrum sp. E3]|nr:hypothetical protein DJ71_11625 [Halorubrum sp. E3]
MPAIAGAPPEPPSGPVGEDDRVAVGAGADDALGVAAALTRHRVKAVSPVPPAPAGFLSFGQNVFA